MSRLFDMNGPFITILTKIADFLCLSVLWVVFSLPIVTMGAASTALYKALHDCIRRNEAGVWKHFWNAFKENFKRSTLAWLIELLILVILAVDAGLLRGFKIEHLPLGNLYWVALLFEAVALTWTTYVAAYAARFQGSVKEVLYLGFTLLRLHPLRALYVMLVLLAGVTICLMVPYMLLFVPALVSWITSLTIEKVFRLHMKKEDLEREIEIDKLDRK